MDLLLVIFFISLFTVIAALLVKPLQNILLTQPLLSMLSGILLGPALLDIINTIPPEKESHIIELACKVTIAMALMSTALRIPVNFFKKNFRNVSIVVFFGMILMWMCSSGIIYLLLGSTTFSFAECLLVGAVITPTDPVVSSTIVSGEKAEKYLPESVRSMISFESGANDGLAYPIVLFAVFLAVSPGDFPLSKWLTQSVLYQTLLAGLIAWIVGHATGFVMHKANEKRFMTEKALLSFSIGLALMLLSGLESLDMNGIIGVFIGGLSFSRHLAKNEDLKEEEVQESMERLVTIPIFFLFGLFIPWQEWYELGWTALFLVLAVLVLRRIPGFLILMPFLSNYKGKLLDILVIGWFGPIGVAALFYAVFAEHRTGIEEVWVIASLIVFSSTIVHGLTSILFEKLYSKFTKA